MIHTIPEPALTLLGRLLEGSGHRFSVVIVGGAALLLRGLITRATVDVDVIAMASSDEAAELRPPDEPLPEPLKRAVAVVAAELELPGDWLNTEVKAQWRTGLPEGMVQRLEWREFGGLRVGIAGRKDLIAMKLYAAADGTPTGKHFQDLLAIAPTDGELDSVEPWVLSQDASEIFATTVTEVVRSVRAHRS
ncbi:MAG: DUF6036 family nucleotidyltransferase [Gemmatimonadales bacterium]|nr:DUF6036 family nucleotidyltransferase [Gemmatimonadales bacterium]MDZ4388647.1 DUF6036 family nucleotidyltransferase [Gemmatimonadales bacterium]